MISSDDKHLQAMISKQTKCTVEQATPMHCSRHTKKLSLWHCIVAPQLNCTTDKGLRTAVSAEKQVLRNKDDTDHYFT